MRLSTNDLTDYALDCTIEGHAPLTAIKRCYVRMVLGGFIEIPAAVAKSA